MSTSVGAASYSKTQLPNKQLKIQSKNQGEEDIAQKKQQTSNDPKKKNQIGSPKNGGQKEGSRLQQNSNLKQSQLQQNQDESKSPYKMSIVTHNNGYYSQKSYRNQRNQEMTETFINKNLQIGEAIDKSQKDIRLKLSQQVHMGDIFLSQPHSQQNLSDWKQEQNKDDHNYYQSNGGDNQHSDFLPQTPDGFNNNDSNNYYGQDSEQLESYRQSRPINLKPSDTKLEDYLNLRNQVQSPSVHQRLYHQAVIQQKQQQQLNEKPQSNHHSIFSVGPRNYSSEKHSQKYRSSSNRKQRPAFQSGSKIPYNDDMSFSNELPQQGSNNYSTRYFSQSQDFGGDDSHLYENNEIPSSYQKIRNGNNYRGQSSGRNQSRSGYKKLNLPQIDQTVGNPLSGGAYPHTTTVRNSVKQPFSRQQSPQGGSNNGFNTPISKTPRVQYKRRDSATRIKDLGNSIQERYSDKIEKMKLKYSSKNPFSQNQDDELDSFRFHQSQCKTNLNIFQNYIQGNFLSKIEDNNIQRKEFQQSIQQAAINIEEQRQRIRRHEEERDQELISQNNTYRGNNNRQSQDHSPRYSSTDRQREEPQSNHKQKKKNRLNQSQQDNIMHDIDNYDESGKIQGNYIVKDQMRKLSSYNLKLNNAEEKIQRILTKEDLKVNEDQQMVKQFSQSNKIQSDQKRNSQQNLAILGNRNQKFIEFDSVKDQNNQREQMRNRRDNLESQINYNSNSNSPRNRNPADIPRSESKTKRIQQNYYYEQDPQFEQNYEEQEFTTHPNNTRPSQTPQNFDDDFSRMQTKIDNNGNEYTNDDTYNDRNNLTGSNQHTNLDEIYQKKRENIVKRVQEDLYNINEKMETFDHVGDLKMKKMVKEQPKRETQPKEYIPQQATNKDTNRSNSKRRSSLKQKDETNNVRYPHHTQHATLIDTFEGEKNNIYNYQSMINKQNSIGKDSRFDTFDSKLKNQQSINSDYQQRMTFLDKKLADLQELKNKQKQKYIHDSERTRLQQKYQIPDMIDEEDRYRTTTNEQFIKSQEGYQSGFETPQNNNTRYNEEEDDTQGVSPNDKNHEIKNYNMVKKPQVKMINKNMNELERIQNNLGNIEKQIDKINQKYNKYQPQQQVDQEMEDRLFTFQVDERIYKKFKKYLPQDVNQRANQVQKYEQFSGQLQDKIQFDEQQQLEDYLDNQIKTQLQKYLPMDVSQRLQIEKDTEPISATDTSQIKEKVPQFEEFINRKIQERLMAYLPNDITTRLNSMPKENQNMKKKPNQVSRQLTKDSDRVLLEKMSPEEQEEFIKQKTQIVNEYKRQQEQLINYQYKLTDEKNIEAEKLRIRQQLKSSENNSRLELQKLKRQNQLPETPLSSNDSQNITPKSTNKKPNQQPSKFNPDKKDNNYLSVQGNKGGQNNILGQIDASESQYITNNEQTVSPKSGIFKNLTEEKSPNPNNHNVDYKSNADAPVRQYNGVLSQDQDEDETGKTAQVFGKIEQYVYKPPTSRSISPTREIIGNNGEQMNTSPDNSTKLNKSQNINKRNGTNNSFMSKGKYSLFQQNNSQNQQQNSNPFIIQDNHHNQNVSFPSTATQNQKQNTEPKKPQNQIQTSNIQKQVKPQQQQQLQQEKVPQILIQNTYQQELNQQQIQPNQNQQIQYEQQQQYYDQEDNVIDNIQNQNQSQSNDNQRIAKQQLDPMTISLSKNQKERNEQQQQHYGNDLIKDNGQSDKDLNAIQEDTKENISTIYNNSGSNLGMISPQYQNSRSKLQGNQPQQQLQSNKQNMNKNSIMQTQQQSNLSQQQQQLQAQDLIYYTQDNQNPQAQLTQTGKQEQNQIQGGYKVDTFQQNHNSSYQPQTQQSNKNQQKQQSNVQQQPQQQLQQQSQQQVQYLQLQQNSQMQQNQKSTQNKYQKQQSSDMFKTETMIANMSGTQGNHFQNSQQDFTVQNKYDTPKEVFNSLLQLSNIDTPFQSHIKMKVYTLQNSNPIDLDWIFESILPSTCPITPVYFQGKCNVKDTDANTSNQRQSTFISYNYNASNFRKEYFKDIHILYQINKEFRQNRENTPTPILLSLPVCFEISKNQLEIVCETSKFMTMSEMIKRRKQQSGQAYNENELAFVFHSLLRSIEVIEKKGILHSYLTPDNLVYCIESQSYKISNFSLSQTFSNTDNFKNRRQYNIYYQQPFVSNEIKSTLGTKTSVSQTPFYAERYALAISFFCIQQLIEPSEANSSIISRALKLMEQKNDPNSISSQIILYLLRYSNSSNTQPDAYNGNQFWNEIFNILDGTQHVQPNDDELASISILNLKDQQNNYQPNVEYRSENTLKMLADQCYTTFQFPKSLEYYLLLLQMQEQKYGKNDDRCIPTLNKIWKIYFSDNDFQNSYNYCAQYTRLARQNYQQQKLQNLQQNQQQPQRQVDSQQNTEQISSFNKLQRNLVTDFNLSGQLKWQLEKQKEAIEDYEMALQLQIEIYGENEYNVIKNLNNIGVYYSNINEIDKAIEIISQAVAKMEQQNINDHLYTSALYNLGNLLSDNGQLQEALPYLTKSYEIKKKTMGNSQEVGKLAHLIGTLHFQLKSYQQSLVFLEEAVLITSKFTEQDDSELIKYKKNYIVSLIKNNQHQQANTQIDSILSSLEQSTFKTYAESPGQVYYELGGFFEKILKYEYALVCYEKSATYWQQMEISDTDPSLSACLARINSLKQKKNSQIQQIDSGVRQQQQQEQQNQQNSNLKQQQDQQNISINSNQILQSNKNINDVNNQTQQQQQSSNLSKQNDSNKINQNNQQQQQLNEFNNLNQSQQKVTSNTQGSQQQIKNGNQMQSQNNPYGEGNPINQNNGNSNINSINGIIPAAQIPSQQQESGSHIPKIEHLTQIPENKS